MSLTPEQYKVWLKDNCKAKFIEDGETLDIVCSLLPYTQLFEEYMYLRLKTFTLVLSLESKQVDESILSHYGHKGITTYEAVSTKENFPGRENPLRITRVGFLVHELEGIMNAELQTRLVNRAREDDHVQYEFVSNTDGTMSLYFAWKNVQRKYFLNRVVGIVKRRGIRLLGCRFAFIDPLKTTSVLIGNLQISSFERESHQKAFVREFATLKDFAVDDRIERDLVQKGIVSTNKANLLRALSTLLESVLADLDSNVYTESAVVDAFCFHPELTTQVLKAFQLKFNPVNHNTENYKTACAQLHKSLSQLDTGKKKHDDRRRMIFKMVLVIFDHMMKTNYYSLHKLGLGFRLSADYLDLIPGFNRKAKYPELPYGIFYCKGVNWFGFQMRFRDLARGGMRTIITQNWEHASYEKTNMFTECYNLAFTQQKKNKDIPEGGAKGILFLLPNDTLDDEIEVFKKEAGQTMSETDLAKKAVEYRKALQSEYLYYNQRCMIHTFLTLFVTTPDGKMADKAIIDYVGVPEYIYLGPDENMHDYMIEWIAKESIRMKYHAKGAFISGKEETGINHKEYGVTSLGVFQFMKRTLEFIGLGGKPYTIKITGGPDGDVAGNMIRLMHKHHKNLAKVVVITDGTGTAYDPEGLDLDTLEGMFHKTQGVSFFPAEKLHNGAFIMSMVETRQKSALVKENRRMSMKDGKVVEEWIGSNEAYQIFSTNAHHTYADVFAPCGGRPRTLNILNVESQMIVDGKPTCKTMQEGANLYITQDAREFLEDRGVLIMRDSSANKCGVISSSYEILSGLSLDDEQFIKMKSQLARCILERLEVVANNEARAMLNYFKEKNGKVRMTALSEMVSKKINQYTDDISAYLTKVDLFAPENAKLFKVFMDYVPKCLTEDEGFRKQVIERVPDMHKKAVIATSVGANLVYTKGLGWDLSIVDILSSIL